MSRPLYLHLSPMPSVFIEGRGIGKKYTRGSQWLGHPMMPRDFPGAHDTQYQLFRALRQPMGWEVGGMS